MRTDPTRISLDGGDDPLTSEISGFTVHGGHAFSAPWITEIAANLWTGGCRDGLVLPGFFRHLVSLYPWEQYTVRHHLASRLTIQMLDAEDQALGQVDAIAAWVNSCRATGPVLVSCQAGLNRSALVTARALCLEGGDPAEVIAMMRAKRSPAVLCNPAFEKWLLAGDSDD